MPNSDPVSASCGLRWQRVKDGSWLFFHTTHPYRYMCPPLRNVVVDRGSRLLTNCCDPGPSFRQRTSYVARHDNTCTSLRGIDRLLTAHTLDVTWSR